MFSRKFRLKIFMHVIINQHFILALGANKKTINKHMNDVTYDFDIIIFILYLLTNRINIAIPLAVLVIITYGFVY